MPGLRTVVEDVYREIMAALSAIDCDAIVSAGELAEHLRSTDPRIRIAKHVPQPALLRRASLFVTHGGRASLLDSVQGTTPVLGMGILADRPGNTAAFAQRGLGRSLEPTATRDEIAEAITDVLGDSRYDDAMAAANTGLSQQSPLDITRLRDSM